MNNINEDFKNPGVQFRGKPFWSWNGKLEKDELIRQISVMKEMGFGGYFIHSHTGLATEYLGEEWFQLVRDCANEGERLGLETWLYDEDRWPSGTVGGLVTKEHTYRQKFLRCEITNVAPSSLDGIVAVFICEVDGLDLQSYSKVSEIEELNNNDKTLLVFTVEEMEPTNLFNGFTYADTMNKEATELFIKLTHERYKEKCGDLFESSIKGIFTDEPQRGAVLCGFALTNRDKDWLIPWTNDIFDRFNNQFNFDLVERLPELFLRYKGEAVSFVKWAYLELLQQLFIENFAKPIQNWCTENKIKFTGHVLHEDSLTSQVAMQGSLMRFYEYMDVPGVDVLCEHNRNFLIVKQLSSAAHQTGKKELLSELYGCTGWQMNFEGHRNVGLWQALYGINFRCHHLSWYTMKGQAKRDYPASILHQSTWWKEYHYIEDYFARIGVLMSAGDVVCDTLVINPVESLWCQVYPGWANEISPNPNNKTVMELESYYTDLFYMLQNEHINFEYGDEEMLSRLYKIKTEEGQLTLYLGNAKYKQVIVGKMTTIRKSTLDILERFIELGGKVIFAGDLPQYVDCTKSNYVQKVATKSVCIDWINTAKEIAKLGSDSVVISSPDVYSTIRKTNDSTIIMLLNIKTNEPIKDVEISLLKNGNCFEYDCMSGEINVAISSFKIDFEKGEAKFFVISNEAIQSTNKPQYNDVSKSEITKIVSYTLDEKNICVLDMVSYNLANFKSSCEQEVLRVDQEIRKKLELSYTSGDMVQPWYSMNDEKHYFGELKLQYSFDIDQIPMSDVELALEDIDIVRVKCNDNDVDTSNTNGSWIDICFERVTIKREFLKRGRNTIELSVNFDESYKIESIYLLGTFGVKVTGSNSTIIDLPDNLFIGDISKQGLPFYSGKVTYKLKISETLKTNQRFYLAFPSFGGALIKSKISEKAVCWAPYEFDITDDIENGYYEVETILTRRNTFGPLHQKPLYTSFYAPESYVTEGENYSDDYMLIQNGILAAPFLIIKE